MTNITIVSIDLMKVILWDIVLFVKTLFMVVDILQKEVFNFIPLNSKITQFFAPFNYPLNLRMFHLPALLGIFDRSVNNTAYTVIVINPEPL